MEKCFRIFFKKLGDPATVKTEAIVEFPCKNIKIALQKAEKMGRKKSMRVAMVAEVPKLTDMPREL